MDSSHLYTQAEEIAYAYKQLGEISNRFTVAAAFGNVPGVYSPGTVELRPAILKDSNNLSSNNLLSAKNQWILSFMAANISLTRENMIPGTG